MYAAYVQEGAPVQLESVTHNLEFLFSKADVKNVSDRTVRSVTFGVLLGEPNRPELVLASRQEVPTDIKPGATRAVDVLALPVKEGEQTALQFKSNQVIVSFGVLGVRFDDGTSWNFDPLKNGGFIQGSQTTPSAKVNCVPRPSSGVMTLLDKILPTALAQTGYFCNGSTQHEICTNFVDSCQNRLCTHQQILNGSCPNQVCSLH